LVKTAKTAFHAILQRYRSISEIEVTEVAGGFTSRISLEGTLLAEATDPVKKKANLLAAEIALGIKGSLVSPEAPLYRFLTTKEPNLTPASYVSMVKNQLPEKEALQEKDKKKLVCQYVQGVVWVMEYLAGSCSDYSYRFAPLSSPSVSQLSDYICNLPMSFTFKPSSSPLVPLHFLMALIPSNRKDAQKHVPQAYQHLLESDSPIADLFHGEDADFLWLKNPEHCIARLKEAIDSVKSDHPMLRFHPTLILKKADKPLPPQKNSFLVHPVFSTLNETHVQNVTCRLEDLQFSAPNGATTASRFSSPIPLQLSSKRSYCSAADRANRGPTADFLAPRCMYMGAFVSKLLHFQHRDFSGAFSKFTPCRPSIPRYLKLFNFKRNPNALFSRRPSALPVCLNKVRTILK